MGEKAQYERFTGVPHAVSEGVGLNPRKRILARAERKHFDPSHARPNIESLMTPSEANYRR